DALNFRAAIVQVLLVAVDHAGSDGFLALQHLLDDASQLLGIAAKRAQEIRLSVFVIPPVAAAVRLIPPGADAGLAGAAIMEEDGSLARLGPVHLRLPFVGADAALEDVMLDDLLRM